MTSEKVKNELISWGKAFLLAAGLTMIIRSFFFIPYIVDGSSMEPALHNKERILVNNLYGVDDIKRGDIVIIRDDTEDRNYIKRVIGFPGEVLEMSADTLKINGKVYRESYLESNLDIAHHLGVNLTHNFGPIVVPTGNYFVMGDNRLYSTDSRNGLGFIDEERITGKGEFILYPFNQIRKIK